MPSIRYTPSSQRLRVGGSQRAQSSGISNQAANIATPQVDTRAGNYRYTPVRYTPMPKSTIGRDVANFASSMVDIAFQYQDKKNRLDAAKDISDFSRDIEKDYYGEVDDQGNIVSPGYVHTTTKQAQDEHINFERTISAKLQDRLDSMDPSVRQYAVIAMTSARDGILSRAAQHRAKEFQKYEEETRLMQRTDQIRQIVADPSNFDRRDPATGLTVKDKFMQTCTNPATCNNEWKNHLLNVEEMMYIDRSKRYKDDPMKAYEEVKAFHDSKVSPELADSSTHALKGMQNVVMWEYQSQKSYNDKVSHTEKVEKEELKKLWDDNEAELESQRLQGKYLSLDKIGKRVGAGTLDPVYGRVYETRYKESINETNKRTSDYARVSQYEDLLRATAMRGYKDDKGNNVLSRISKDLSISNKDVDYLVKLSRDLTDPKFRDRYQRGSEAIRGWTTVDGMDFGIFHQVSEITKVQAKQELWTALAAGVPYDTIYTELEDRYNPVVLEYDQLPPTKSGFKPKNINEIKNEIVLYRGLVANNELSQDEYNAQIRLLNMYTKNITARYRQQETNQ